MNRNAALLLLPAALLAAAALSPAFQDAEPAPAAAPAAPEEIRIVVLPPQRTPHWDTVVVDHDLPERLLVVPQGQRFVLTDLLVTTHDYFRDQAASADDRLWLEGVSGARRSVVFDALSGELDLPLHWETGVAFGPGDEVWFSYKFAGDGKSDWLRRLHYSGYFEAAGAE
ncbi:MAG: hypothetical protein EYC70_15130 [Planctomycetota bacterium]|nr:MAG: hypothetical protein EYC70_15130 [Planctomycetota bacterium]